MGSSLAFSFRGRPCKMCESVRQKLGHTNTLYLYSILVKIKAVLGLIFCACDTDGDNRISQEEIEEEQCVAIQKSIFHGNYIDQGGFDFLRTVNNDADDSEITRQEAGVALTNIIDTSQEYYEFFTGESNKNGKNLRMNE